MQPLLRHRPILPSPWEGIPRLATTPRLKRRLVDRGLLLQVCRRLRVRTLPSPQPRHRRSLGCRVPIPQRDLRDEHGVLRHGAGVWGETRKVVCVSKRQVEAGCKAQAATMPGSQCAYGQREAAEAVGEDTGDCGVPGRQQRLWDGLAEGRWADCLDFGMLLKGVATDGARTGGSWHLTMAYGLGEGLKAFTAVVVW
ncbi:hypothetical protein K431DRAFT_76678 [Polychaeton citri CBS 116435]|uniref:Uncharacterized protein n=1 Tax=Polychaeton citri CBS 116435 TaxID=1314669 RepID=A0A9P4Q7C4_9PEZI|nr:hypothetical protein K431DRAFT_76678 [Polychaeton citri CBS 116435]